MVALDAVMANLDMAAGTVARVATKAWSWAMKGAVQAMKVGVNLAGARAKALPVA